MTSKLLKTMQIAEAMASLTSGRRDVEAAGDITEIGDNINESALTAFEAAYEQGAQLWLSDASFYKDARRDAVAYAIKCVGFWQLYESSGAVLALLRKMQRLTIEYLKPDGGLADDTYVNEIIGLLDGPEQRAAQRGLELAIEHVKSGGAK